MTGKRREGRRNVKRGSVSHGGRHPRRGARPGRYAAVEGTLLSRPSLPPSWLTSCYGNTSEHNEPV